MEVKRNPSIFRIPGIAMVKKVFSHLIKASISFLIPISLFRNLKNRKRNYNSQNLMCKDKEILLKDLLILII